MSLTSRNIYFGNYVNQDDSCKPLIAENDVDYIYTLAIYEISQQF